MAFLMYQTKTKKKKTDQITDCANKLSIQFKGYSILAKNMLKFKKLYTSNRKPDYLNQVLNFK